MIQDKQKVSLSKQNVVTFNNETEALTIKVTPTEAGTIIISSTNSVTQNYIYPVVPLELKKVTSDKQVLDKIISLDQPVISGFSKEDAINNLDELFRQASMLPYIEMKGLLIEMINEGDITTQDDYNYYIDSCIEFNHYDMPEDMVTKLKNAGIGNQSDLVKSTAKLLVDTIKKLNERNLFDIYSHDSTTIDNQKQPRE